MEEIKTKVCSRCGRELPVSEYHKNAKHEDGLQHECKDCRREIQREYYLNRKKKQDATLDVVKVNGKNLVYTNAELAKFQPRELLAELKARDYEWEKMYAPRQEVLYSKV